MKTIAAVIAGLLLSFMTFVGGLFTSTIYLGIDKPHHRLQAQDATALWTSEPVAVGYDRQPLQRLPARPLPAEQQVTAVSKTATSQTAKGIQPVADDSQPMVDPVTTGAIDPSQSTHAAVDPDQPKPQADLQAVQNTAHVEWCSRRYRSYQAADNTYRSYSGNLRTCQSPYSNVAATDIKRDAARSGIREAMQQPRDGVNADDGQTQLEQASLEKMASTDAGSGHVQACQRRYHSYRVEDNSYQPYDGGPRRQCQ